MSSLKIKDCFNGRFYEIPKYQRGYAWERENVRELFDDLLESMETQTSHYIGTLVLSQFPEREDHYHIVDGQQRIATIMLIMSEILRHLSASDRAFYHRFYIAEESEAFRLRLLGKDATYFTALLKHEVNQTQNRSQRLLKEAYEEIRTQVTSIAGKLDLLKAIEKLELMEFIEASEGDAIRIFQTVNDRGKLLSNMEKAKSLLVYFSNRYLEKKLDDEINGVFGEVLEICDDIKHIGEVQGIDLISSRRFNEDDIMRYHFVSYSSENYDATAAYVLTFLKRELGRCRTNSEGNGLVQMENLIRGYTESLYSFCLALQRIVKRVETNPRYYALFVILGLSATLYPLLVKLEVLEKLDKELPGEDYEDCRFFDLLETIDVRVYKTRGTDPRADISRFACELSLEWSDEETRDWLLDYSVDWMSEELFRTNLSGNVSWNQALRYVFIDYCAGLEGRAFTIEELRELMSKSPTIEHILSQTPTFAPRSVGFKNEEDFEAHEHTIGNLTILEQALNSAASKKMPVEKVPHYDKSRFRMTRALSSSIASSGGFTKTEVENRTRELCRHLVERWSW